MNRTGFSQTSVCIQLISPNKYQLSSAVRKIPMKFLDWSLVCYVSSMRGPQSAHWGKLGPQLVVLLGKVVELLGGDTWLEEAHHCR